MPISKILVIDDESTDDTVAVVEDMAKSDSRIRLIRRPHAGPSASRNFGVSVARGDLISPLDSDDLWHPEKIAKQVRAMQASDDIGLVYCWTVDIDETDLIIPPIRAKHTVEGDVLADVSATAGLIESSSTPMFRKKYFEMVGGYDETLVHAEDWKLQLALAKVCRFAVVPEHLVGYRQRSGSLSKNVDRHEAGMAVVSRWILGEWPDMPAPVRRAMTFNLKSYLAHQALANGDIARSVRLKSQAFLAMPSQMASVDGCRFAARLLVRMLGIRGAVRANRSPGPDFKDTASWSH